MYSLPHCSAYNQCDVPRYYYTPPTTVTDHLPSFITDFLPRGTKKKEKYPNRLQIGVYGKQEHFYTAVIDQLRPLLYK